MRYENIYFDFDGTLVNTVEGTAESAKYALKKFNINTDEIEDIGRIFCGPPLYDSFSKFLTNKEDIQVAIENYRKFQGENTIELSKIYEGVVELLCKLKQNGAKISIVTIKKQDTVIKILKYLNIYQYFDTINGISEKFPKQDKKEMLKMISQNDNFSKSIMIGDRKSDIIAGKFSNMDTIAVLYGMDDYETISKTNPTYYAKEPLDILNIINNSDK